MLMKYSFLRNNFACIFIFFSPDVSISVSSLQSKENISLPGNRRLYFDTHALVCLLEENGNLLETSRYFNGFYEFTKFVIFP